jgi:hypothetical protein
VAQRTRPSRDLRPRPDGGDFDGIPAEQRRPKLIGADAWRDEALFRRLPVDHRREREPARAAAGDPDAGLPGRHEVRPVEHLEESLLKRGLQRLRLEHSVCQRDAHARRRPPRDRHDRQLFVSCRGGRPGCGIGGRSWSRSRRLSVMLMAIRLTSISGRRRAHARRPRGCVGRMTPRVPTNAPALGACSPGRRAIIAGQRRVRAGERSRAPCI